MKRIVLFMMVAIAFVTITGCSKKVDQSALDFKEEYEALNGKTNQAGKEHRALSIPEDNPYEKVSAEKIVEMIDEKESFYVYFGDPLCPWCRSVLEKSIEVAKNAGVEKIYYVKIWDEEGTEVLRDKYQLNEKNKPELVSKGTEAYYALLERFDSLLTDYTLKTEKGKKVEVGEKRIYAPNFVYIKEGEAIKLVEGISEKQTDPREELSEEILADEQTIFEEFFNN